MGFNTKREGFVRATDLCVSMANDMKDNGFNIIYLNGVEGPGPAVVAEEDPVTVIILEPTSAVDPLVDSQPWRVVIEARSKHGFTQAEGEEPKANFLYVNGHHNWIRFYICPPEQILVDPFTGLWRVAYKQFQDTPVTTGNTNKTTKDVRIKKVAGMLTLDSSLFEFDRTTTQPAPQNGQADPAIRNGFFYCFNEDGSLDASTLTQNIPNWGKSGDFQAHPLSYRLVLSDHGIAFALWGESYDSSAREFAWFCTQRMVDKDTGAVIVDGKAPLVTVFSLYGNGNDQLNEADPTQIQYIITRESDINTPTFPRSAVVDEADSTRIINSVQQVSIGENKNFIVHFPNGLTTQRYGYPHELDMIAYTSADVVSQENHIEMTFFGEAQPRKYAALASNNVYNKGMRMLFQVEGTGITVNR
jgi:hypothetical protein